MVIIAHGHAIRGATRFGPTTRGGGWSSHIEPGSGKTMFGRSVRSGPRAASPPAAETPGEGRVSCPPNTHEG